MGRAQGKVGDLFTSVVGERRGLKAGQRSSAPESNELPGDPALENLPAPFVIQQLSENSYDLGEGETIHNVHPPVSDCKQFGCALHAPTPHATDDLRLHLRQDSGLMERICPHGVGHPDPDSMAYFLRRNPENKHIGDHGCDGCCTPEARVARNESRAAYQEKLAKAS